VELINNIFANRRSGGSGNHYAISNQASSPSYTTWNVPTSRYNLLVTANTNTVGEWGLGNNNITDWRANSTSDILSYYVQSGTGTGQLNLTNLFSSINQGTLNLQTTNAEVWYVYGKGITGSVIDNLNTDFSGVSRSTSQGIATTIGSAHMASAPSMLPVAAIASGAPAANTTTTYTFAGRPVATVNWGSSAPTSATVYDFTGVNPPASPAGNFNNRYVRIDVSGGTTPYSYGLTYNFNNANLGGMQNPNNMRLATSNQATPTSWAIQFTTIANGTNGTATVSGLSTTGNAITFTGTELNAPPSVLSFTPSSAAVGASVTIRGTLFTGASALSFNGVAQSTYTVVNDTTITTTVPFGATTGPVSVTNPFGTGTSLGNFTVIQPPTVTAFSPGSGTFGTAVTITGTNFSTATRVRFNTTLASFTIVNSTTITATVPSGSSTGVISVINPADSAASSSTFTVFPVATISSFTPASGPVGTNVTIIGNNFNAITAVRFNGVNASFTVVSVTEISATVPNGSSTGAITVINGSGTGTSGTNFTVTTPPTVTSFTPSSGGVGSTVTIFGTNFTGTPTVTFNTTNATSVTVINSTQLTAVVPAGATSGLITVTTSQGSAVSAGAYTVFTDLIVNSNQFVFGTYNNITVTGTGIANLTGTLTALGNVTVQTGGRVVFGTEVINGLGNFTANSGSRLVVGSAEGINAFGTTGNLQINGTRTVNSGATVEFNNNTGNQNSGNLITNIDTLIINTAGGDLILNTALTVNNRLVFTAGSVRLGPNNLTITNSSATLPGLNASSYIKTDGIGSVRRNVLNNTTNVLFPVGSLTLYSPAQLQLTNASTADIFSVRVFNSVLTGGTTGSAIATSMVNNTWVISENTVGGSNATLSVTWNNGQEVGGFNRAQCAIFTYNTGTSLWTRPGAYGAATGIDPYTRTVSGLTFFNAFTVGDNLATPLPVNLLTFKATAVDNDVVLNWITASEQNNKGFFVERSADGETFETVTFVGGRGNSTTNVKYLFTDEAAFDFAANNTLYYRLRQVDFDGTETISDVIAVTRSTDVVTYTNAYPNPFTTGLKLDIVSLKDSDYNMMIADMQGRVVLQKTISVSKGFNQIDLKEMDELKSGVYFINLNGADAIKVKVIKTN